MPSGGARAGAGRKPTRERFASQVAKAEKQIADKLPAIIEDQLRAALHGDVKAGQYLIDRILGKPIAVQEHTGPEGGPIQVDHQFESFLDKLYKNVPEPPTVGD